MIERAYKTNVKKKQYRAVVIDMHKVFKILVFSVLTIVVCVMLGLAVKSAAIKPKGNTLTATQSENNDLAKAKEILNNGDKQNDKPDNNKKFGETVSGIFKGACKYALGFSPYDLSSAVAEEVPGSEEINSYEIVKNANETESAEIGSAVPSPTQSAQQDNSNNTAITADDANNSDIKAINAGQNANSNSNDVKIGNQTSFSIDIDKMLSEPANINMTGDGPKILIVHTHATEAYAPEGAQNYNRDESDRSMLLSENVVAVGDEVAEIFNQRGLETLHDTALHDYPSFNGAYADALSSIEWYLSEYPSIQVVFDIHRDSIVYDDNTKAKVVTKIDGKNAAQLMFVVGTNEKGLFNPDWRDNLGLALQFQNAIDQKYPNLMRHVNLRQERFNCHATHGSMIIEVGSSGNSLDEAKYGMSCAAEVIADYLINLR